jgi:hypothetical protein
MAKSFISAGIWKKKEQGAWIQNSPIGHAANDQVTFNKAYFLKFP